MVSLIDLFSKSIEECGGGGAVEGGVSPFVQINSKQTSSKLYRKARNEFTLAGLLTCMALWG